MRHFKIIATILLFGQVCYGQTKETILNTLKDKESFINLTDSIIRKEIASFSIKGSILVKTDSLFKSKMIEIPLYYCSDTLVYFTKGSTYIHLYPSRFDTVGHKLSYENDKKQRLVSIDDNLIWGTEGEIPQKKIDSIFFVIHSHFLVRFPKTAFSGIYEPNNCTNENTTIGKKKKNGVISLKVKLLSPYYKVFQTQDRRRIYLYMLNGKGKARYEVTWVIQDGVFLTRIVDNVY